MDRSQPPFEGGSALRRSRAIARPTVPSQSTKETIAAAHFTADSASIQAISR
jgi:hypothetical protein